MKTFLNVGCGPANRPKIKEFDNDDWKEIRFDIDEECQSRYSGHVNRYEVS